MLSCLEFQLEGDHILFLTTKQGKVNDPLWVEPQVNSARGQFIVTYECSMDILLNNEDISMTWNNIGNLKGFKYRFQENIPLICRNPQLTDWPSQRVVVTRKLWFFQWGLYHTKLLPVQQAPHDKCSWSMRLIVKNVLQKYFQLQKIQTNTFFQAGHFYPTPNLRKGVANLSRQYERRLSMRWHLAKKMIVQIKAQYTH